ncbi:protein EXECUTER 1, chloroplastic isoform X2 [Telopea speciosissima]|uniref:protein EXECUTER 1, chloroplastic isoform X2 n=1 Tax=Telopea speciosissima TaxID=54955 RepID=UPI001CC45EB3|nr:protein EXECUTER 1, chloroplastic isoform X2 [Telopea speciosissima]
MASISTPPFPSSTCADNNSRKFSFTNSKSTVSSSSFRHSLPLKKSSAYHATFHSIPRASNSAVCRCQNRSDSPSPSDAYENRRWLSAMQEVIKTALKMIDDYRKSYGNQSRNGSSVDVAEREKNNAVEDWDWDRWTKHFGDVEEQERIVSILESQLGDAVYIEDYEEAAKLKVAIAAAATKDTVGTVISHFKRAIEEERYRDAAFFRDHAGAGLTGWWVGISKDPDDTYGRIIRITTEHGKYVARSYSPRQLATATAGVPLFEVFLTMNDKGEFKQQAVYLKQDRGNSGGSLTKLFGSSDSSNIVNPLNDATEGESKLSSTSSEDTEDEEERDDDSDMADELNILRDMIPGVKVKVVKVTAPGKLDRDLISKVIEDIMEEEDEEKDMELESVETEDEDNAETDQHKDEVEADTTGGIVDSTEEGSEMAVKVLISGLVQKPSSNIPPKDKLRVPARLERTSNSSFTFSIEEDGSKMEAGGKGHTSTAKSTRLRGPRSIDHVMSDLAKFIIAREKIPMKVLKDVGELLNLSLSQAQKRQSLSGSTLFNRIDIPPSSDPLSGLYIGAHGLYSSEIIHLRRKFGMWQEEGTQKPLNLEFYEYVEALKLTGDPYVPAGQVAFRAKVGKRYQLPHKGIIPEELGVIARYRGQGRLAEPGFRNPRWVDGELVILDGKYIKGGPVVGFVYWAPEYHFLVFFNRLRLQQ